MTCRLDESHREDGYLKKLFSMKHISLVGTERDKLFHIRCVRIYWREKCRKLDYWMNSIFLRCEHQSISKRFILIYIKYLNIVVDVSMHILFITTTPIWANHPFKSWTKYPEMAHLQLSGCFPTLKKFVSLRWKNLSCTNRLTQNNTRRLILPLSISSLQKMAALPFYKWRVWYGWIQHALESHQWQYRFYKREK